MPEAAYRGLAGFDRIWLLFVFHRSQGWKSEVRPPRGGGKRSVLATRSPHRPNPIGLSLSRIVSVQEDAVVLEGVDLLDGKPILDLKPFVPLFDTPPDDVRTGWFEGRAERVFERKSDDRFAMRSRR